MKFGIVTHVEHKQASSGLYAYEPYVREMNLWIQHVNELYLVAPITRKTLSPIDTPYKFDKIHHSIVPSFDITSLGSALRSLLAVPINLFQIFRLMRKVDHIHLRCPGNIGLLGCFVQILFPKKPKTVKYAGNWDPSSKQPFSYRLQKWIVSNTFLTRNCKVLVYGNWPNQSKNIVPFFTASYAKEEIEIVKPKTFDNTIQFIYVGGFTKGKQPLKTISIVEKLIRKGYQAELHMYGDGALFEEAKFYVREKGLDKSIVLHGNVSKREVKKAYQKSHFLIFISKSEGWPKVVAESMFWSCVAVSSKVSCVPFMLDSGNRGVLINNDSEEAVTKIEYLIKNQTVYQEMIEKGRIWSQKYTLNSFDSEIKKLLEL